MKQDIEYYGFTRSLRSIKRADVICLLIDAATPVSQVDKQLAHMIAEDFKPCIIVVNKWDLARDVAATEDYAEYLTKVLPGLKHAPIAFTTAVEAKNVPGVLDLAVELFKQASKKIPTGKLNKAVKILSEEKAGSRRKGGLPKIYYATQVSVRPVSLLLFVNRTELFDTTFQRYLVNRFSELLGLEEVPVRLLLRPKGAPPRRNAAE